MTEEVFWRTTPRKLHVLSKIYIKINSPESSEESKTPKPFGGKEVKQGFIDQVL